MQTNGANENVEPTAESADSMRSTPAAMPRRPKPGILRLDIGKPRRSSGGSVDFRCVSSVPGCGGGSGVASSGSGGANSATGANSEVSEHDLLDTRECLRFAPHTHTHTCRAPSTEQ
ncbi:transmembrane channel-like protein [Drosophila albomicans]|uniref:Transmembrane channel-like protein n=1 Tax=Drosophila albomicans TaxID=7291 RepID=A0A9C6WEA6_DROAB|nr:transmembrane channel-like protein [Drosophila albomicans]